MRRPDVEKVEKVEKCIEKLRKWMRKSTCATACESVVRTWKGRLSMEPDTWSQSPLPHATAALADRTSEKLWSRWSVASKVLLFVILIGSSCGRKHGKQYPSPLADVALVRAV